MSDVLIFSVIGLVGIAFGAFAIAREVWMRKKMSARVMDLVSDLRE